MASRFLRLDVDDEIFLQKSQHIFMLAFKRDDYALGKRLNGKV